MRLFVALTPPPPALEHLKTYLDPYREAQPTWRWTAPEQWHITLAFMADVAERHLVALERRLTTTACRQAVFTVELSGGGAFPNPAHARVVYTRVHSTAGPATVNALAGGVRGAATQSGAHLQCGRFEAHLTLARIARPFDVSRWLDVLHVYRGPPWQAAEIALIRSHLGEGPRRRPRYEVLNVFPLAAER